MCVCMYFMYIPFIWNFLPLKIHNIIYYLCCNSESMFYYDSYTIHSQIMVNIQNERIRQFEDEIVESNVSHDIKRRKINRKWKREEKNHRTSMLRLSPMHIKNVSTMCCTDFIWLLLYCSECYCVERKNMLGCRKLIGEEIKFRVYRFSSFCSVLSPFTRYYLFLSFYLLKLILLQ